MWNTIKDLDRYFVYLEWWILSDQGPILNDNDYLNLLIIWRQEEILSLGSPKLEWVYSQRCPPFIPIQRPPTNDLEPLLWRQSDLLCRQSDLLAENRRQSWAFRSPQNLVDRVNMRNHFPVISLLHDEPWLTSNPRSDSLMIYYILHPTIHISMHIWA